MKNATYCLEHTSLMLSKKTGHSSTTDVKKAKRMYAWCHSNKPPSFDLLTQLDLNQNSTECVGIRATIGKQSPMIHWDQEKPTPAKLSTQPASYSQKSLTPREEIQDSQSDGSNDEDEDPSLDESREEDGSEVIPDPSSLHPC